MGLLFVGCATSDAAPGYPQCWSARFRPKGQARPPRVLLDSGAWSDRRRGVRFSCMEALEKQFRWERLARRRWGADFQADIIVAYDQVQNHEEPPDSPWNRRCIELTVRAAHYLSAQRWRLAPRTLCLPVQGNGESYLDCLKAVLRVCRPSDWLGLGGWCVLGRNRQLFLDYLWTMRAAIPLIAARGVRHVHIFGMAWPPALAVLSDLCRQHDLSYSCDAAARSHKYGVLRGGTDEWFNVIARI